MKQELQEDWKQEIALLLLKEQHEALVAFLNEHALIKKRLGRKLEKLLEKQKKKQEKKQTRSDDMTTFAIATLGCKVNTYESQGL